MTGEQHGDDNVVIGVDALTISDTVRINRTRVHETIANNSTDACPPVADPSPESDRHHRPTSPRGLRVPLLGLPQRNQPREARGNVACIV